MRLSWFPRDSLRLLAANPGGSHSLFVGSQYPSRRGSCHTFSVWARFRSIDWWSIGPYLGLIVGIVFIAHQQKVIHNVEQRTNRVEQIIKGKRGPIGKTVRGPAGPRGARGATGARGPRGLTAVAQGPRGAPGSPGATGPRGPRGFTGAIGPVGPVGPAGHDGAAGPPAVGQGNAPPNANGPPVSVPPPNANGPPVPDPQPDSGAKKHCPPRNPHCR